MTSRVVHVRLDDWALIGCHDILKSGGKVVAGIPMSTIVRQVVGALVRNMQLSERIPTYNEEARIKRVAELYMDEPFSLDEAIDLGSIVSERTEDDEILSLVKEAVSRIETEGEPQSIAEPVEISEAEPVTEEEKPTLNLLTQDFIPFHLLAHKAPKDRFIEWAEKENDIIQAAVCITYTGLPQELWGSEKAEEMISDLLSRHRGGEAQD